MDYNIFYLPFVFGIVFGFIYYFLVKYQNKTAKKYWDEHDHTKAKRIYEKDTDHSWSAKKGIETIVVNPHKWIIIKWNKDKNQLDVWEPKHTYKTPDEYKLAVGNLNWKFVRKNIKASEYFKHERIR